MSTSYSAEPHSLRSALPTIGPNRCRTQPQTDATLGPRILHVSSLALAVLQSPVPTWSKGNRPRSTGKVHCSHILGIRQEENAGVGGSAP